MTTLNSYTVTYSGNNSRFANFSEEVNATSQREAVEKIYGKYLDSNYFPQDDGIIKDCDGHTICDDANDLYIEHDGGYFYAELSN